MDEKNNPADISLLGFLTKMTWYLEELAQANRKLLNTLEKYQDLLVEGENHSIERATPGLDRGAGEIRKLDEERRAFVDDFFTRMDWDGPRNFSSLERRVMVNGVTDEEAVAFDKASRARMDLIKILAEVDAQNSLNLTLIGQGLNFAEVSLKTLLGFDNNPQTYGPKEPGEPGPSLFDTQA